MAGLPFVKIPANKFAGLLFMGIKEGISIGINKLKAKISPVLYEKKVEEAIQEILFETHQAEYEAFDERDVELVTGRTDLARKELLYYPNVKNILRGKMNFLVSCFQLNLIKRKDFLVRLRKGGHKQ